MIRQRFFINEFDVNKKEHIIADREIVHQVLRVLRLKVGDEMIFFSGDLRESRVEIIDITKEGIRILLKEVTRNHNEPEKEVALYQSLVKKDTFEWIAQKATEIGVKRIIPIITERTVKMNLNASRMEKIIKEAAEQSGRALLPTLEHPIPMVQALQQADDYANLFFDASGKKDNGGHGAAGKGKTGIWVGPEGGWTTQEIRLATDRDFTVISIGKLILRAETAAVIGCYIGVKGR